MRSADMRMLYMHMHKDRDREGEGEGRQSLWGDDGLLCSSSSSLSLSPTMENGCAVHAVACSPVTPCCPSPFALF